MKKPALQSIISVLSVIVMPLAMIIAGSGSYHLYQNYKESKIKPGQIYVYTIGDSDPFAEKIVRYQKVIQVKEGYVQYVDTITSDTSSQRASLFLDGTNLINN